MKKNNFLKRSLKNNILQRGDTYEKFFVLIGKLDFLFSSTILFFEKNF